MRTPSGGVMAAALWAVMLLIAVAALVAALRAPFPGDPPTGNRLRHAPTAALETT
jgi:hypothetical protein